MVEPDYRARVGLASTRRHVHAHCVAGVQAAPCRVLGPNSESHTLEPWDELGGPSHLRCQQWDTDVDRLRQALPNNP